MRRVILDDTLDQTPVVVGQQDGHEVWLVNPHADLADIIDGCNRILNELAERPRRDGAQWRLVRRLVEPVCRRLHTCDD